MYVIEHLEAAKNPIFSYEIIPPLRGKSAKEILAVVEQIIPYDPPFIDVTSHSAEAFYREERNGTITRKVRRKRTGTISLCGIIQNRYNIDTVPHLLCRGFTKEETEDAMIELSFLGIHNVLAIRGDETNYKKPVGTGRSVNEYAVEMVSQLNELKQGQYIDEDIENSDPIDLCVGVGGYPEKHMESPNLKTDIQYLKQKIDAGADYVVSQMFFDNQYFYDFVKACRDGGITVPIIPGLKLISSKKQLSTLPKNFHITIPEELSDQITENSKHAEEIGIEWCLKQSQDLLNNGINCVHFYIMSDAGSVVKVVKNLR